MASLTYQSDFVGQIEHNGSLRFDPDGYADICIGGLNAYNSVGAYYVLNESKAVFDASEHFMRRVKNGALYGEFGHPKFQPGMSKKDWLIRVMTVEEKSISHHFKDVTLVEAGAKNQDGSPMVLIYGRVKPAGPYGQALGESLESAPQNTAFSIRSITDDFIDPRTGVLTKIIRQCITFDFVVEPGIYKANKFRTIEQAGLGSMEQFSLNPALVKSAISDVRAHALGLESADILVGLESLLKQPQARNSNIVLPQMHKPLSAQW